MTAALTPLPRALADLMSDLSEAAYFSEWLVGLEYRLWQHVIGDPRADPRFLDDDHEVARLTALSQACGGWIVYDRDRGKTWLPIDAWEHLFSDWSRINAPSEARP